jgi:asparagine synthase (glutamine-hydrolysing)
MCGIAGFLDFWRATSGTELRAIACRMAITLQHRGPDDGGVWVDEAAGIALAHRRLSILDLSPAGHQPMESPSGRYIIVYNGEIYNFLELLDQLKEEAGGCLRLRGRSDTEVLLLAIEHWGLRHAIERVNGMFAFAIWDRRERTLHLGRDRFGEKPLYYGWAGKTLIFGSELKALQAHPDFVGEIDRDAMTLYLRHSCIPAPYSIYKGIMKLPPATLLSVRHEEERSGSLFRYWSLKDVAERGEGERFQGSEEDAVEQLDSLLRVATKIRMISDVPLGSFLSGGVDSSTVTALMQAQSGRPVRTFTIGNRNPGYDEARQAFWVAKHLGTEHTELYVSPEHALQVIPRLPSIYDEPFGDYSQIPTYLLSQLTRQYVTVGLSGDGGDEIFGGYNRHVWSKRILETIGRVPMSLRRGASAAITSIPAQSWDAAWLKVGSLLPKDWVHRQPGYKLHKLAGILGSRDLPSLYHGTTSQWFDPVSVVIDAIEPPTALTDLDCWPHLNDFSQKIMYMDTVTYLHDDILTKVDRASMAAGLEARAPLLDHRIAEFAWTLPLSMKIRGRQGKWALRQVLHRYVPRQLVERPKSGFGIPLGSWLRGPLRDWADSMLDSSRLRRQGFFHPEPIQQKWREHLSGRREWEGQLWIILMFQAWLEGTTNGTFASSRPITASAQAMPSALNV